jgi:hypothetical protein
MKPERTFSLIAGIALLVIGGLSLIGNIFLKLEAWRLWPMIVVLIGLGLTLPGFLGITRRGFGSFFIPGIPVLTTGAILLYASLFHQWDVWAVAWPLEVLGVALGFVLAAIFMRVPALAIPASIIGVNGLILAFCAVTGLWTAWALLWPLEPFSVGLGLLILGLFNRSEGVKLAAMILFGIAGLGFFIASFISVFNDSPILRFIVPTFLLLTGGILLVTAFARKAPQAEVEAKEEE